MISISKGSLAGS